MEYPTRKEKMTIVGPKSSPYFSVQSAVGLIGKIVGKDKLKVDIREKEELLTLLATPENYLDDPEVCTKIKHLNELLSLIIEKDLTSIIE